MMVNKSPQLPAPVLAGTVEASPAVLAAAKESWAERGRTVLWGLHRNWWCNVPILKNGVKGSWVSDDIPYF